MPDNPRLPTYRLNSMIPEDSAVILDTPQGTLVGEKLLMDSADSQHQYIGAFKGIPYAMPPTGNRRWKPAEPAGCWAGERLATQFAPSPIQPLPTDKTACFYHASFPTSEDCLYLNVWAPIAQDEPPLTEQQRPVMVWIFGGGLLVGSTQYPMHDGAELASKDVIVVTINYRLGVLGYFSHPELSNESPNQASGNYGLTDQIEALRWVQNNIAAFGGDANNVTIFGESAGALSVSHLLASPLAKGLFHKAIMQSAYLPPMPLLRGEAYGMTSAEAYGNDFAHSVKATTLPELRALPADQLLTASLAYEFNKAVVDNWSLTAQIFETFEQGLQQDVPVLAGFNSYEGSYFGHAGMVTIPDNESNYVAHINNSYGELAEEYLRVYPANNIYHSVCASIGEGLYAWATEKLIALMASVTSPAYLYYLDHCPAWAKAAGWGAFHGCDINYVFNNIKHGAVTQTNWPAPDVSETELAMAELISNYWVAFASSSPQLDGQPCWQPYRPEQKNYMPFREGKACPSISVHEETFQLHETIVRQRRENNQCWTYKDIGFLAPVITEAIDQNKEPA